MRVVLDTNVFVSALLGGRLRAIVDAWKTGRFTLIVSEAIMREYLDIINRPKFEFTMQEIAATTDYLFKHVDYVTPTETITVLEADPSDNIFLEAAIAGEAAYIVSGDHHLLALKAHRGVAIITAHEFIARLASSD